MLLQSSLSFLPTACAIILLLHFTCRSPSLIFQLNDYTSFSFLFLDVMADMENSSSILLDYTCPKFSLLIRFFIGKLWERIGWIWFWTGWENNCPQKTLERQVCKRLKKYLLHSIFTRFNYIRMICRYTYIT